MRRPHAPARWAQSLLMLPLVAQVAGCTYEGNSGPAWIAPLDGQTAVATDLPLIVQIPGLSIPPDYPTPDDLIRVVDLGPSGAATPDTEGQVPGTVVVQEDSLRFVPSGRWQANRRYAWVVTPVDDIPHDVELRIPGPVRGTAVFDTSAERIDVLAGTAVSEREACFVVSRPLRGTDLGSLRLTMRYELLAEYADLTDFTVSLLPEEEWSDALELDGRDQGGSVLCVVLGDNTPEPDPDPGPDPDPEPSDTGAPPPNETGIPETGEPPPPDEEELPTDFIEGAIVRVWFGEQGPWRITLGADSVTGTVRSLRRWTEEEE